MLWYSKSSRGSSAESAAWPSVSLRALKFISSFWLLPKACGKIWAFRRLDDDTTMTKRKPPAVYIYIITHRLNQKNNKMEDYKGYLEVHHGLPSSQTWLGTPPFQQLGWGLKNVDPSPHDQNHRRPSKATNENALY